MFIVIETAIAKPTPCASAMPVAPSAPAVWAFITTLPAPRNTNNAVPTNSAASGRSVLGITVDPRR